MDSHKKAKKRKGAPRSIKHGIKKKKKMQKEEDIFNHVKFKFLLRDNATAISALEKFIEAAEVFSDLEETNAAMDIVRQYCKSSPEYGDIFALLEVPKRKPSEVSLIFQCLECILNRVTSDLQEFRTGGQSAAQRLLGNHADVLYRHLGSNKSHHLKMGLRLLRSVAMLGGAMTTALLSELDFSRDCFTALARRRDTKDEEDVRTCFVYLVLSLLHNGDRKVLTQLIDQKSLLQGMLEGLQYDSPQLVETVLSKVLEKIVQNPVVTKTQKVRVFEESTLPHLAKLLQWKGPSGWQHQKKDKDEPDEDEENTPDAEDYERVMTISKQFLRELLCSTKNGIIFLDPNYGTSPKNQNHLVTSFLRAVAPLYDHQQCRDVVVGILRVCPDQLRRYLPMLIGALQPRPSGKWLACISLLIKIYQALPGVPDSVWSGSGQLSRQLDIASVFLLPPQGVPQLLHKGLEHQSMTVRHRVLEMFQLILTRTEQTLQEGRKKGASAEMLDAIKTLALKACPDMAAVFQLWEKILAKDNQKVDNGTEAVQELSPLDHAVLLEEMVHAHQLLNPDSLTSSPAFLPRLLEGIHHLSSSSDNTQPDADKEQACMLPKLHLLKILAASDARKLPWAKKSQEGQTLMYLLLEMLVGVREDTELAKATQSLLIKVLMRTGLFEDGEQELNIWLSHLCQANKTSTGVLAYFAQVLTTYISNPYPYFDHLTELCADASSLAVAGASSTVSSSTKDLIQRVLAMSEEEFKTLECQETQTEEGSTLRQRRLPFSPLCVVALEMLEKMENSAGPGAGQLLGGALLDLFHTQTDPAPLSLLVTRHQAVLTSDLVTQYLVSWTQQAQAEEVSPTKQKKKKKRRVSALESVESTLWFQLRQLREDAELADDAEFLQSLSQSLTSADEDQHLLHSQTLLLYISDAISKFEKTQKKCRMLLKTYFKLLTTLVQKVASNTEEPTEGETTPTANSELLGLGDSSGSLTSKLCSMDALLGNLLKHPRLCQWFGGRGQGQPGTLSSSASLQGKLAALVTDCLCGLLKSVHSVSLCSSVLEVLKSHADALCSMVSQQLKDDGDVTNCVALQALQSLLPFLDSASSMAVLDMLLELPVKVLVTPDTSHSLSTAGTMVVQVASQCLSRTSSSSEPCHGVDASESPRKHSQTTGAEKSCGKVSDVSTSLTADKVGRLFELLKTSSDAILDEFCTELIQRSPHFSRVCSAGVWRCLLEYPSPSRSLLLQQLLVNNSQCCKEFVAKATADPRWLTRDEVVGSGLIVAYLKLCRHSCDAGVLEVIQGAFLKTAGKVAMETRESILEILTALVEQGQVAAAKSSRLWNSLCTAASKGELLSRHHLQLMRALLQAGMGAAEAERGRQAGQALVASCGQLQARLTHVQYSSDDPCVLCLLDLMLAAVQTTPDEGSLKTLAKSWMSFLEAVLKHLYLVPSLHLVLARMVPLVYSGSCDPSCPIKSLQEMVMARKLFLPVLFGEHGPEVKDAVVTLLLSIVETSAACCDSAHIKVLLSAYSATLSLTDQRLLRMMYLYEEHGVSFSKYKPLLWGARAMEHYSAGKTGLSLWLAPTFDQLLAALDPDTLHKSALLFPLRRSLLNVEVRPAEDYHSRAECYDPAFLLPFLAELLEPDSAVDCGKLLDSHCVAFLLSALSSHLPEVRGQAYTALSYLHQHLQDAWGLRCRQELQQLLQLICASCQHPLQKLSCLTTAFLARAAALLPHPESHMYQVVKEYLELKPQLDLTDVPEFYKLFNSSSIQHKEEQMWMLSLLADGVRETSDVSILNRRYVLKLLLSFYDSPVCDAAAKIQILRLVQSHCAIKATDELTLWLTSAMRDLQQSAEKQRIAKEILRLLEEKERRKGIAKKTSRDTESSVETPNGDMEDESMECEN